MRLGLNSSIAANILKKKIYKYIVYSSQFKFYHTLRYIYAHIHIHRCSCMCGELVCIKYLIGTILLRRLHMTMIAHRISKSKKEPQEQIKLTKYFRNYYFLIVQVQKPFAATYSLASPQFTRLQLHDADTADCKCDFT